MPFYGNMYSGMEYLYFDCDGSSTTLTSDIADVDDAINTIVSQRGTDSIVSLTYVPKVYFEHAEDPWGSQGSPVTRLFSVNTPTTIGSYTPRNKKLLCFPYLYLCVDTIQNQKIYRYERFTNRNIILFKHTATIGALPSIFAAPINYNGNTEVNGNATEGISLNSFPQLAMPIDSYRAWVANGGMVKAVTGIAGGVIGGVGAAASGNVSGAVTSVLGLANTITDTVLSATQADTAKGVQDNSPTCANRQNTFYYKCMGVTEEYARMIDDYFDRYGYATNRLKVPNTHVRENYTYTKTNNCTIEGAVPMNYLDKIKQIFNRGITFWTNGYNVGNYNVTNRPLSEIGG